MSSKIFSFDASSFSLDPTVEAFLKSKGAISSDFGSAAYVYSGMVGVLLTELITSPNASSPSDAGLHQLEVERDMPDTERERLGEENSRLSTQVASYSNEMAILREQLSAALMTVETLKASNAKLEQVMGSKSQTSGEISSAKLENAQQSYEKMERELQQLRSQNIEAIASLKVLEDENDELRKELEQLRQQPQVAPAATTT